MVDTLQLEKWELRHAEAESLGEPAQVLVQNLHLLPDQGRVLDLACGRGANALLMAQLGLEVVAWDFSRNAISRLKEAAAAADLAVQAEIQDVLLKPPPSNSFDLVLVSYFLERSLLQAIKSAVKPGGLLIYETFSENYVSNRGPTNSGWRLKENELLALCNDMTVLFYREDSRFGKLEEGWRDVAMIVAAAKRTEVGH